MRSAPEPAMVIEDEEEIEAEMSWSDGMAFLRVCLEVVIHK